MTLEGVVYNHGNIHVSKKIDLVTLPKARKWS